MDSVYDQFTLSSIVFKLCIGTYMFTLAENGYQVTKSAQPTNKDTCTRVQKLSGYSLALVREGLIPGPSKLNKGQVCHSGMY